MALADGIVNEEYPVYNESKELALTADVAVRER